MYVIVHAQGKITVHGVGGGKQGKKYIHVVVE